VSRVSMRKISEILRQRFELRRSYREIGQSLNISISTISDYINRAKNAGIAWPLPEQLSEQELYDCLFLSSTQALNQKVYPDWEWVHQALRKKSVTLKLLWHEYRTIHANGLGYTQFCVQYRTYVTSLSPVIRQAHKAGEKIFVDYASTKIPWLDHITNESHEAEIFIGYLGASQLTFVNATHSKQLSDWIESHIQMFEYFGGVSEIVVPNNVKSTGKKAHRYDPDINANYQHISEHYGFAIVPAYISKPKDKAKVENTVACIERQILAPLCHKAFTSIVAINEAIKSELVGFNEQFFQNMNISRRILFENLDKPALKPLPTEPYQYAQWHRVKVQSNFHFVFNKHYYSVPFQYAQKEIEIRSTKKMVECFYQGGRIAIHAYSSSECGFTTLAEHMPPAYHVG